MASIDQGTSEVLAELPGYAPPAVALGDVIVAGQQASASSIKDDRGESVLGATPLSNLTLILAPTPDTTPPQVRNFSPIPGTPITRSTPIEFDVVDAVGLRRSVVEVSFGSSTELVHDGDGFTLGYATSSRAAISGGFHYLIVRRGGWPTAPTIKVIALDTSGNEA